MTYVAARLLSPCEGRRTVDILSRGGSEACPGYSFASRAALIVANVRASLRPGFGHSDWPDRKSFAYAIDHYAGIMNHFTEAMKLARYTLYMQDYGAPWAFAWP